MREWAMQFAESYRLNMERLSGHVRESIKHPSLYVFAGDCGDAYTQVYNHSQETLTGGAFFLELFKREGQEDAVRVIRNLKTEIQKNEADLNIKRINIHVCVLASNDSGLAEQAGSLLRKVFCEDFPIVHMTLFILLSESNRYEDYERRSALSLQTLRAVEAFQHAGYSAAGPLYDIAYVLSDRNENDIVSDDNMNKNYEMMVGLHYWAYTESRFEDSLRQKSMNTGSACFASAGMACLAKPNREIAFAVFQHVFEYLLMELQTPVAPININTLAEDLSQQTFPQNITEEKIVQDLMSVASKPVNIFQLRNINLREAEKFLFGEGAARFFEANGLGLNAGRVRTEDAVNTITQVAADTKAGPFVEKVLDFNGQEEAIATLKRRIASCEQEIEHLYGQPCKPSLLKATDAVKRQIAEVYVARYRMMRLCALLSAYERLSEALTGFTENGRACRTALEDAKKDLAQNGDPGQHISAYYKRVTDGILSELESKHGRKFLLDDAYVGSIGPEPDLKPLADRLITFLQKHILTHASMQLTFDEDLQLRAKTAPDEYDSEFTHMEEFYRRLLEEVDRKAALAVSLQRYDGLNSEKFYFGDVNGPMMRQVRQLAGERTGEAVYFINEPSGFKVIRLTGGFTPSDLTRYRVMRGFEEGLKAEKV